MSTFDQEPTPRAEQTATEAAAVHAEADRERARADAAESRVAELERELAARTAPPQPTEPTAADAASLEQQNRPAQVAPPAVTEAFPTAPTASDAASLVQQEPPPTGPGPTLTAAQEESVDAPPAPTETEEDPAAVIAAGGHLDAAGHGCYCDRGGGHAPLDEDARQATRGDRNGD